MESTGNEMSMTNGTTPPNRQQKPDEEEEAVVVTRCRKTPPPRPSPSATPGYVPVTPPDGGYGWAILVASFMINMIVDGVCFTVGIFIVKFNEYYQEGEAKTAWIGSILNGMYLSMGPIAGACANRYGCRKVTIAGSIIVCIAFFISTYSTNINMLIISYGAIGGIGFGFMYLPAIVMVGFYFEKRRAFATGVAVCGSGIGGFIFAPMCNYLLEEFGWKGATWIVAAIVLNGVVCGAVFRPLERTVTAHENRVEPVVPVHSVEEPLLLKRGPRAPGVRRLTESDGDPIGQWDGSGMSVGSLRTIVNNDLYEHKPWRSVSHIASDTNNTMHTHKTSQCSLLKKKDIFYSGSMHHLHESTADIDFTRDMDKLSDCFEEDETSKGGCSSFMSSVNAMTDFSMLKDPVFCVYGLSCFLCMAGFFVPFIHLPTMAKEYGISKEKAAFLISVIGIANTVARIITGWVSDKPWADCLLINNCALIVGGISTMLCPYCLSYDLLIVYGLVFGSSIAAFVSLRSIIMVELMGLERLTNAFGLVTMCQGFSSLIGAPIAAAVKESTGDFTIPFILAGGCMVMAGIICMPLRRIAAWQKNKRAAEAAARGKHGFARSYAGSELCIEKRF